MSYFNQNKNKTFCNNRNESNYSNSLGPYRNNNINELPSNFYAPYPNFIPQNSYLGIPFNYIIPYPIINNPVNIDEKIKNNNDKINKKFEEMNSMIKKMNEDIITLKEDKSNLQKNFTLLQESNTILQERITKLQEKLQENNDNLNNGIKNINTAIININNNMDKMNKDIKEIQLKIDLGGNIEEKVNNKINNILNNIKDIIKEMNGIKDTFNFQIEKLQNENNNLVERLKLLEKKVNELQGIIIGRKIIKLIIKKILKNCFIDYQIIINKKGIYEINKATLKDSKYAGMVNVINHLIEAITTTNGIIHLIDTIDKSITIINKNTTFGDIINICDLAIKQVKKNDINSIKSLFTDTSILNNNVCQEIIGDDPKIKDLLSDFLEKK